MSYAVNSLEHQWMPFTSNKDFKADPRLIVRAEGCYLWSHKGEKILDGSSGLFCVAAGHGRKEIADAVHAQLLELDYTAPFQMGHPAAFEVARRVSALTPAGLDHIFFANSGSEAVDSAMKIALAYHYAKGEGQRQRFVSRERAYHGVNFGGVALSGLVKNREAFGVGLPGVAHMRHTWMEENRFTRGQPENGAELAEDLARIAANVGPGTIAACFVEPVAGSTGFLIPPKGYLERLREICDDHGILLVFDEVICGFGRTGEAFAAQTFNVKPDMMTMAKALTNGCQPMGAVAVSDEIYDSVTGASPDGAIELFHGYTYSGHPAACAASLATLDIYERENLFARGAELSEYFLDQVFALSDLPVVTDIRGFGLMAAVDVAVDGAPGRRGTEMQKRLYHAGLHVKFTGDAALLAPPLVAERAHIDEMVAKLRDVLISA
jgi:beta-alanine--pyruvate transaminase